MSDRYGDFSFQHLNSLPSLQGFTSVQLAGNEFVDTQDLSQYSSIKTLNISYNNIRQIWKLPQNLYILQIYNNMIEEIQSSELPTTLVEISMSFNLLTSIEPFLRLQKLEFLQIKNNKITSIAQLSLLLNLKELDVEGNDLTQISDLTQFEQHKCIVTINLAMNPVSQKITSQNIKLQTLPYMEGNSYSQSKSTYDSSIIAKKIAESMENDIDFLQELDQKVHEPLNKLELNISNLLTQKPRMKIQVDQEDTSLYGPKSLSPMNSQNLSRRSSNVMFYQPNNNAQFKTFQDVFKGINRNHVSPQIASRKVQSPTLSRLLNEKETTDKDTTNKESTIKDSTNNDRDLKQQNSNLIQQKYKLEQQVQFLIKQNETFYSEIQGYQLHLENIISTFDPNFQVRASQNSKCSTIHSLLDLLETKIPQSKQQQPLNSILQRLNKKIKITCSEIEQKTLDKISHFNHKVLRIEKGLQKIQESVYDRSLNNQKPTRIPRLNIQSQWEQDKFYSLTARNSDLPQNPKFGSTVKAEVPQKSKLFMKSTYKTIELGEALMKKQNFDPQKLSSIRSNIKKYQDHISMNLLSDQQ